MTRLEIENILLDHCYNMSILKKNAPLKKKESILDSLISAIVRSDTKYEDIIDCIKDVDVDEIIDLSFFDNGGDIKKFISEKWLNFAMALWRQRSTGLGTPNAASGEGELMFIFLSKHIIKPTKGDLIINGCEIELKGESVRVNGKISGKSFRQKTLQVCRKYNLTPNKSNRTELDAVELEKIQHFDYWQNELSKLPILDRKMFVYEWLRCIDDKYNEMDKSFVKDVFIHTEFIKEIVKILYKSMVNDSTFDKFVLLGDGTNVKIFSNDITKFNEKIDNGAITIHSDYFRINQDAIIGWYIS